MKAISDNLIHFIGRNWKDYPSKQFAVFESILNKGLMLSPIETHYGFAGKITNRAVCFTDMPLNFCDEHTATYGKFGIGFEKRLLRMPEAVRQGILMITWLGSVKRA